MMLAAGLLLWLAAALLLARLLRLPNGRPLPHGAALWTGALAAAAILLFRPHEELIGGQDAAAYVNAAHAIARHGSFSYIDPLLSQVPPETRPDFLYRHRTATQTKDGALYIKDIATARVGVHFQPAYSLMMSLLPKAGWPFGAWYVAPLFAVLAGLALARLARMLLGAPAAGLLTFLFYISNPLLIWHARYARPEVLASFFFFGGLALLLAAWRDTAGRSQTDLAIGALAVALAPFFHITGWMLALPAAILAGCIILSGRRDFLLYPCVAAAGLLLFILQSFYVADPYNLGRRIQALWPAHAVVATLSAVTGLLAIAVPFLGRARRPDPRRRGEWPRSAGLAAGLLLAALFAGLYIWLPAPEQRPPLARQIYHYIYRTDLPVVVSMLSRPVALLGLLGLIALAAGPRNTRERVVLLAVTVPATLMIGVMYDFFMTRYMLTALIPLLALALAALITEPPLRRSPAWLIPVASALVIALQVQGRTTWITTTAHRGLTDYFGRIAETVKRENGILLCEYSRFAAPFEHYYGIPTLSLDNETRFDYSAALKSWARIAKDTGRPAFFLTPFQPPRADWFHFQTLLQDSFAGERLREERFRPPRVRATSGIDLALYRMRTNRAAANSACSPPFMFAPDESNLALKNFDGTREKAWEMDMIAVGPGRPLRILREDFATPNGNRLLFFVYQPLSDLSGLNISVDGIPGLGLEVIRLDTEWTILRINMGPSIRWRDVTLISHTPVLLADIKLVTRNEMSSWSGHTGPFASITMTPMKARWSRGTSSLLMPLTEGRCILLLLAKAPETGDSGTTSITLCPSPAGSATRTILLDRWTLDGWVLPARTRARQEWLKLEVTPTWDPQERKMASDLGVLVGRAAVIRQQ